MLFFSRDFPQILEEERPALFDPGRVGAGCGITAQDDTALEG